MPGDVSKPEDVQKLVNQTMQRWGKLDIVIANAGFGYRAPIVDGDVERWKNLLDTNVYGLLLTLKYGVEQLLKQLDPLQAKEIARVVIQALEQPRNVDIAELTVYPTKQTGLDIFASAVTRQQ